MECAYYFDFCRLCPTTQPDELVGVSVPDFDQSNQALRNDLRENRKVSRKVPFRLRI